MWFLNKKKKEDEVNRLVEEALRKREEEALALKRAEEAKAAELIKAAELLEQQRKDSDEPWFRLENSEVDASGRIRIELDWNPAFIKYLREECNFTGMDDEQIVQRWLGALYGSIHKDGNNDALDLLSSAGYEKPATDKGPQA